MNDALPVPAPPGSFAPPWDIFSARFGYLKGAGSALGAVGFLLVVAIAFGVPPVDLSFSIDQIIWLVAIVTFVVSLPDMAVTLTTLVRPALILRFDHSGLRIGGAEAPALPFAQIVSIDARRIDDADIFEIAVRPPAPALSWRLWHLYGLHREARADVVVYRIARKRLAPSESEWTDGLRRLSTHVPVTVPSS